MSWAKLDDQFHAHRKAKIAWKRHPRALGLHLLALSYCAGHLTDGFVDFEFVEEKVPKNREVEAITAALIEAGLWSPADGGWQINDWLEYNPSRADVLTARRKDAERKRRKESGRNPDGIQPDSARSPVDPSRARAFPDPTRPDPTVLPGGVRAPAPEFRLEQIKLPGGDLARLDGSAFVQRRIDGAVGGWLRDCGLDDLHADDGIMLVRAMLTYRVAVTRDRVLEVDALARSVAAAAPTAAADWVVEKACKRYIGGERAGEDAA